MAKFDDAFNPVNLMALNFIIVVVGGGGGDVGAVVVAIILLVLGYYYDYLSIMSLDTFPETPPRCH